VEDLTGRDDVERLLRAFYGRALVDELLGHVFVDVVHMDLEEHLPVITDFWMKVLFDEGTYSGRTMEVHRRIHRRVPLTEAHFARWLELWDATVAEGFDGPVAAASVSHAHRMAAVFLRHLAAVAPPRSLPVVPR
jgi:hemoglobin